MTYTIDEEHTCPFDADAALANPIEFPAVFAPHSLESMIAALKSGKTVVAAVRGDTHQEYHYLDRHDNETELRLVNKIATRDMWAAETMRLDGSHLIGRVYRD
jgi:hypothetical protein